MNQHSPAATVRPPCTHDDALAVVARLREAGHVAYFAGGCVRDVLMGLTPKDYDVATDAPPARVRELFPRTQAVGAAFGVILVRQNQSVVEVATFRTDVRYEDGRRPAEVRFTTAEEDARRRDFTINGLFFDPIDRRVIDYVGGQADLNAKILRAIGEPADRFAEDHLRLLRAVRFASRFSLTIEPATTAAMLQHAIKLKRISPERIAEELRLMLTPPSRATAWEMLWRYQLIQVIFRILPGKPIGMGERSLFCRIAPEQTIPFGLALSAATLSYRAADPDEARRIIELLDKPEVRRSIQACRTALRISNDESDAMKSILGLAALLTEQPPVVSMMKRFLARAHSSEARRLLNAIGEVFVDLSQRINWLIDHFAKLDKTDVAPPPLVTGDDLTNAGYRPGPRFKRVLDAVYDAQLEDRIATRQDAMELARQMMTGE